MMMNRRIRYALVAAVLLASLPAHAQYNYVKKVTLTITTTAGGSGFLNSDVVNGSGHPQARVAVCRLTTASGEVGYTTDGTAPTTSATGGLQLEPGDSFILTTPLDIVNFKAIALSTTTTNINCQIYG